MHIHAAVVAAVGGAAAVVLSVVVDCVSLGNVSFIANQGSRF